MFIDRTDASYLSSLNPPRAGIHWCVLLQSLTHEYLWITFSPGAGREAADSQPEHRHPPHPRVRLARVKVGKEYRHPRRVWLTPWGPRWSRSDDERRWFFFFSAIQIKKGGGCQATTAVKHSRLHRGHRQAGDADDLEPRGGCSDNVWDRYLIFASGRYTDVLVKPAGDIKKVIMEDGVRIDLHRRIATWRGRGREASGRSPRRASEATAGARCSICSRLHHIENNPAEPRSPDRERADGVSSRVIRRNRVMA